MLPCKVANWNLAHLQIKFCFHPVFKRTKLSQKHLLKNGLQFPSSISKISIKRWMEIWLLIHFFQGSLMNRRLIDLK